MTCFSLEAVDGAARAGVVRTAHGAIPTPAFMPVGTKGTVKSLHPDEVRELGAHVILGNTYHLHFRPGEDVVAELGGLHAFSGWSGPILTDSGGFQVFSLRDTLLATDDDGVTFRSVYDGAAARFTPELSAEVQRKLGSDIAMCFDVCPPAGVPQPELEEAVRLTSLWARRQREEERARGRSRRSSRSASTGTRSAGWRWGRTGTRCSTPSAGPRRSCPPSARGTSWASATPRESSRSSPAGSTCSTASCRPGPPEPAPR
jgi:queuine/archaeosine tRNA-ribosyltransferase